MPFYCAVGFVVLSNGTEADTQFVKDFRQRFQCRFDVQSVGTHAY